MKLLLIDNRVQDVTFVTNNLLSEVYSIVFDFNNDTFESLIEKISQNNYKKFDSVGIFQENFETSEYQILNSFEKSILFGVEIADPTLDSWKEYIQLIKYLKYNLEINNIDLMGCNIGSSQDWKYIEKYLENTFNININSSIDITGQGGNWILEEGNLDLVGSYFIENIKSYGWSLGQNASNTYVITKDNKLYGTGKNVGEYPFYISLSSFSKVLNIIGNILKISCGSNHTAMILSDGSLWTTGSNSSGQLGTGNTINSTYFVKVYTPSDGITVTSVSCSSSNTAIILSDGSLWTTGYNSTGQLGRGNTTNSTSFVKVYTPSDGITVTSVSCGYSHTAMILSDGSLWTTGDNSTGQLGTGNITSTTSFIKVYTPLNEITVTSVSCGSYHTAMILSDGSLWTTGSNSSGQLGRGNTTNSTSFVRVYDITGTEFISNTMILSDQKTLTITIPVTGNFNILPVTGNFNISNKTYLTNIIIDLSSAITNTNVIGGFTYSSSNPLIVSISGSTATINGAKPDGVTIIATPINTTNYIGTLTTTFNINKAIPTIITSLDISTEKIYGDMPFTINFPVSNNIESTWSLSSSNTSVATIDSNIITIIKDGITYITATQIESTNFVSFTTPQVQLVINKCTSNNPLVLQTTEQLLYTIQNTTAAYINISQNITNISKLTNNARNKRSILIKSINKTIKIRL